MATEDEPQFLISKKSPAEWLAKANVGRTQTRRVLAMCIVKNGQELAPDVDWETFLEGISYQQSYQIFSGYSAIEISGANSIGHVASEMRWGMDTSDVVYMSGFHLNWHADQSLPAIRNQLEEIRSGARTFLKAEDGLKRVENLSRLSAVLSDTSTHLEKRLGQYANFAWPNLEDKRYLDLLKLLTLVSSTPQQTMRRQVLRSLKDGNIEECFNLLQPVRPQLK